MLWKSRRKKAAIGIVAVTLTLLLGVFGILFTGSDWSPARAHEDGTLHIHPTLTPTPEPTPPPLPLLGLDGPLTIETSVMYQQTQHRLVVTTTVNNPPPEGWYFGHGSVNVNVVYKGWSFETSGLSHDGTHRVMFQDDKLTANLPLPEYVDLTLLEDPMIARVYTNLDYYNNRGPRHLSPSESMYVDLRDRDRWEE